MKILAGFAVKSLFMQGGRELIKTFQVYELNPKVLPFK